MIRGKKNFLPSCQLQLGFGLLFRLDDESMARHKLAKQESSADLNDNQTTIEEKEEKDDECIEENGMINDKSESSKSDYSESASEQDFPDVQVIFRFIKVFLFFNLKVFLGGF